MPRSQKIRSAAASGGLLRNCTILANGAQARLKPRVKLNAQGVAAAAKMLGIPATIVMPADAPSIKLENTRALGAEVVLYNRLTESREKIARQLANTRGATLVPSFDDPFVIAGQRVGPSGRPDDKLREAI